MKRPQEKEYFEYRGKTLIMYHGRAENFMDAQDEYIDYLEAQIKSQEYDSLPPVSMRDIYGELREIGLSTELADKIAEWSKTL